MARRVGRMGGSCKTSAPTREVGTAVAGRRRRVRDPRDDGGLDPPPGGAARRAQRGSRRLDPARARSRGHAAARHAAGGRASAAAAGARVDDRPRGRLREPPGVGRRGDRVRSRPRARADRAGASRCGWRRALGERALRGSDLRGAAPPRAPLRRAAPAPRRRRDRRRHERALRSLAPRAVARARDLPRGPRPRRDARTRGVHGAVHLGARGAEPRGARVRLPARASFGAAGRRSRARCRRRRSRCRSRAAR